MGRKIFISYKYKDSDVKKITDDFFHQDTVRDYVNKIEELIDTSTDHIYKGEHDDEDLSHLSEEQIWESLKNKIYDSTLTIVLISKNMKDTSIPEKEQWIPNEISYCLKEISRKNENGDSITSRTNAILAVVIPDSDNSYSYYTYNNNCCDSSCRVLKTGMLFNILKRNMFNRKDADTSICDTSEKVWHGDSSYIISVKWEDFIDDMDKFIKKAYELQDNIDEYIIYKEVD